MRRGSDDIRLTPRASLKIHSLLYQERIMTSFLFGREEKERVTSYSGCGESRIFRACTINTSGRVVASVQVKRE